MSENDLIEASPCKLRNGDWGCKTQEPVQVGDSVQIVTRANKQWRAEITQVVWTDGQVCICATASENEKSAKPDTAAKPAASKNTKAPTKRPRAADDGASTFDNAPPAPPRTDVPATDDLDAMADRAADQQDDFDDIMNAADEFERGG